MERTKKVEKNSVQNLHQRGDFWTIFADFLFLLQLASFEFEVHPATRFLKKKAIQAILDIFKVHSCPIF